MPNDIVSEISMHFLSLYPLFPPLTGRLSPTTLTHICREWREVALATPALWRAIGIYSRLERHRHISDIWLSRSGCCPLSIYINEQASWARVPEIFSAVLPHRARWQHLRLNLSRPPLPQIEGPMPLLCHVDLSFHYRRLCPPRGTSAPHRCPS